MATAEPAADEDVLERFRQRARAAIDANDLRAFSAVLLEEAAYRRDLAPALRRSYPSPVPAEGVSTLVIAFAGLQQAIGGGLGGGVPPHEFVRACGRAGAHACLFVRDACRSWYLRGVQAGGSCERM